MLASDDSLERRRSGFPEFSLNLGGRRGDLFHKELNLIEGKPESFWEGVRETPDTQLLIRASEFHPELNLRFKSVLNTTIFLKAECSGFPRRKSLGSIASENKGAERLGMNETRFEKPWGYYSVILDEDKWKVKKILVKSGHRLSLQSHRLRKEHWFIVQGKARVTLGDELRELTEGEYVDIPQGTKHRIENVGEKDLVFIEVQTGEYFGEDDIVRYEDDYGRVNKGKDSR